VCKNVPSDGARQDRSDALRKLALTRRAAITYAMYHAIVDDLIVANPSLRLENKEDKIFAVSVNVYMTL